MRSNNRKRRLAYLARGFAGLCAALALGIGTRPAAAAPFAYVANNNGASVSIIDTANTVVTREVLVGSGPAGLAVTPDGKFVYVAFPGTVMMLDSAGNRVGAEIHAGIAPDGVAITPDGKFVYVTNTGKGPNPGNTVSVIATASNTVVATVTVGLGPFGVAVTPDGKFVYVANYFSNNVSVIVTCVNVVVVAATVGVGSGPEGVAITPDGKFLQHCLGSRHGQQHGGGLPDLGGD